ncbi:MAG TPA: acyl-CoA dehydrogenase family protein [Aggregatilineales bacterium]|nr:acyl-CoA dehydrogenase [Chloroflexota bacterium]HOA23491.1 acyl-CoA dehydrogenase family protein [Aggregatilineales bacterium]HPV06507.1 acyl-CoA dehydrogenase family protein [Aggregatilineales bacterium]HQA68202.1 acyl-CoA dehydrogenase family protein [Aggregatilineales bacterium]
MDFSLTEEQRLFQRAVRDFAARELAPYAAEVDEKQELRWDAIRQMPRLGLLGLQVPEEYGGAGLDSITAVIALEEIARACGSTALAVAAHNSLCCAPIVKWGTEEQKAKYLPTLTSGEVLGALALTEPDAGSDLAGGVRTSAVKEGDSWIVDGSKMWITNASSAPVVVTLVRTNPQAEKPSRGLSMLLIDGDTPGFEVGPPIPKFGVRGSHSCPLTFDNARVPLENLLGEEGRGLHQALEVLDGGRIGIAAVCVGLGQAALDEAVRYVRERETFGKRLAEHDGVRMKLAEMATRLEAARRLTYYAAWCKDQGRRYTHEAAMAKLFASEASEFITREALQLHGGYGYSTEFPVERIYRDQRLMSIGEGANEILRLLIGSHVTAD